MTTPTLLSIYDFGKVLGLNPLHVMGVDAAIGSAASRVSVAPITQYSWQDADGVSREELAQYIADAEEILADYLGYWPAARWTVDERIEIEQPPDAWFRSMYDMRGDRFSVKASKGQLISGGIRAKTLISAGTAVVYTDADTDTYLETATIGPLALPAGVTDPEEIAVYYPGLSGDDEWEVRPISASIAGGNVTIVCRREQLAKKELLEALDARPLDGFSAGNFLATVDVYRKYHDPSVQVQLVWRGTGWCNSCSEGDDSSCTECGLEIQPACMTIKDKALGVVTVAPGEWDSSSSTFSATDPAVCSRRPDYVRLWYRSGYKDMALAQPNVTMDRGMKLAVAKLAISRIDRQINSSKGVSDVQSHWSADLRRSASTRGGNSTYKATPYELENCPFGTTVAAIEVWRWARRRSLGL